MGQLPKHIMWKLCVFLFALFGGYAAAQRDPRCGPRILSDLPKSWFTSPSYPGGYPNNIECEWVIETEPGNIIEIMFMELNVGSPFDVIEGLTDYVMIYDTEDPTTRVYFDKSTNFLSWRYRSQSNKVTIEFFADGIIHNIGFNATYNIVQGEKYCGKNALFGELRVDVRNTRCTGGNEEDKYETCFVRCRQGYSLKRSSKVTCRNGMFHPQNPCKMIAYEVQLCDITNMLYCRYKAEELATYWSENDYPLPSQADDVGEVEVNFDLFPDPDPDDVDESDLPVPGGDGMQGFRPPAETQCIDMLIGYSYCAKKKKKDEYAFSCQAFLKIKKLNKEVAKRKVTACYKCRGVDCTQVVYI